MTQNRFNYVKANFSQFEGKQVEFKYYIPSADKYATAKGILRKVGTGCNENCFIIGERGKDHAIYFENVTIIDEPETKKIVSTYWNAPTREKIRIEVDVTLVKTYRGHDIYKDADDWYYVNDGSNYQYFDSVREAQKFIRDTAWEQ